jgi:hypothetical protein
MDAKDKDLKNKIRRLNEAYIKIEEGRKAIEALTKATNDMSTAMWRFIKAFKGLNQEIFKQLKSENLDNEFKRIIKDLE